ncbi:MAG: ATP-binding protein, partial [Methylococcales bacterium]
MRSLPEKGPTADWWFAPFRLNPANQRLWREGEAVALRPKAFAVLSYLVEQRGQLVDKNQLLDAVWGHRHVSESVLEGCVSELRKALGDDAKAPRYLETAPRRGYRFVAEVKASPAHKDPSPEESFPSPSFHTALLCPVDADQWVGRQDLLQRLQGLWREAQRGERRLVFLTGEAGLGKTTLIEMFLRQVAEAAGGLLWGQCIEHFGLGEAFLPLLSALQQRGHNLIATLRSKAPAWLVQLPGLLTAEERLRLQPEVLGATRERMLREGCELLEALSAEMPLIVVLEDLHWSDYATVDLLAALGRRRGRAALLVLGSYRPSDVTLREHPLRQVQQELQAHRLCAELQLDSFSLDELGAYLARRFPDAEFPEDIARVVHRRSGGHPLFVVNLLDYLLAEGKLRRTGALWSVAEDGLESGVPATVRALIEHQITRLSEDERWLLEAASAAGMESSAALLAAGLEEDPLGVEARCETLARRGPMLAAAGVVEWPDGAVAGNYAFRHALYAEVLYQRLTPAYRVSLHRRLGERLEAAYSNQSGEIAAELARHFEAGRDFLKATHYLRLAAEEAVGRFANREAIGYLTRALELVERLCADIQADSRLALLQYRALIHRSANDWPAMAVDLEALACWARAEGRREQEV